MHPSSMLATLRVRLRSLVRREPVRKAAEQNVDGTERIHALETQIGEPSKVGMGARERLARHALRGRLLERDASVSEKETQELAARVAGCA